MASVAVAAPHTLRTYPSMIAPVVMSTSPDHPDLLLASGDSGALTGTALYDVSGATPVALGRTATAWWRALALAPSGTWMVAGTQTFSLPDFTETFAYPEIGLGTAAVAISPAEDHVAASAVQLLFNATVPDLKIWPTDSATASTTLTVATPATVSPALNGLAYDATGRELFVAESHMLGGPAALRVIDRPDLGGSALTLTAPATMRVGTATGPLSGRLSLVDGASVAGQSIRLVATAPDESTVALGAATTSSTGAFTLTPAATLDRAGSWTLSATWQSDGTHRAAEATATVRVGLRTSSFTFTRPYKVLRYGRSETLTAHLGNHHASGVVSIYATPYGGTERLIARGEVNAKGNLQVAVTPRRDTGYRARYAGDDWYAAAGARRAIGVRVVVSARMRGGYATTRRGYRLYHYTAACGTRAAGCPTTLVAVAPNHAGKRIGATLEVYVAGGWHPVQSVRPRLSARSAHGLVILYRSSAVIGVRTRVIWHFDDADHHGADAILRFVVTR